MARKKKVMREKYFKNIAVFFNSSKKYESFNDFVRQKETRISK